MKRLFCIVVSLLLGLSLSNNTFAVSNTNSGVFVFEGTVVDEQNQPIIGATIICKNCNHGTTSDFDGHFILQGESQGHTIQVSATGYYSMDITLIGPNIKIIMSEYGPLDEEE